MINAYNNVHIGQNLKKRFPAYLYVFSNIIDL